MKNFPVHIFLNKGVHYSYKLSFALSITTDIRIELLFEASMVAVQKFSQRNLMTARRGEID